MNEPEELLFTSKLPEGDYPLVEVPVDGSLIEGNRFDEGEEKLKPVKKKKLTQKERLFCLEYLISSNATQSAIKAGYSENCAGVIGYENLKKPHIKKFLDENKSNHLEELHITAQDIIKGLHEIATNHEAKDADKINAFDKLARHINFYEVEKKTEAQKEITVTYTKEKE